MRWRGCARGGALRRERQGGARPALGLRESTLTEGERREIQVREGARFDRRAAGRRGGGDELEKLARLVAPAVEREDVRQPDCRRRERSGALSRVPGPWRQRGPVAAVELGDGAAQLSLDDTLHEAIAGIGSEELVEGLFGSGNVAAVPLRVDRPQPLVQRDAVPRIVAGRDPGAALAAAARPAPLPRAGEIAEAAQVGGEGGIDIGGRDLGGRRSRARNSSSARASAPASAGEVAARSRLSPGSATKSKSSPRLPAIHL